MRDETAPRGLARECTVTTTYEIVLRGDGEEERYIDHPLEVGQQIQVDLDTWVVAAEEPGSAPWARGRFICLPAP